MEIMRYVPSVCVAPQRGIAHWGASVYVTTTSFPRPPRLQGLLHYESVIISFAFITDDVQRARGGSGISFPSRSPLTLDPPCWGIAGVLEEATRHPLYLSLFTLPYQRERERERESVPWHSQRHPRGSKAQDSAHAPSTLYPPLPGLSGVFT